MERLDKLEEKLDALKDDIHEVKADVKAHIETTKIHMDVIKEHIAGDKKIINTIDPLMRELPDLVAIVKDYQFEKEKKRRQRAALFLWTKRLTLVSALIGAFNWIKQLI